MKRAAIYSRVSTQKEEQARALENHEAGLRRYIAARGFRLDEAHVFLDRASGGSDKRTGYQALLAAARARRIDVIVVTKLDRLARSLRELVNLVAELGTIGVDLIVTDQAIDTTTSNGRLQFHLMAAFAEFERDMIRDRVNRGLDRAREKGKKLGRPGTVVDLDEVRRRRGTGESLRAIASSLPATIRGKPAKVSATWLSRRLG